MRRWLPALLLVACSSAPPSANLPAGGFHAGADLSFLQEIEQLGGVYRGTSGAAGEALQIFRAAGLTTVRLRVWNAPPAGFCDLGRTLQVAARAHAAGLALLIDFHYSDVWADPGHQAKPAAWSGLHGAALEQAIHDFTRGAVAALVAQGTPPALVQVGNEVTAGLLWDDGRLDGSGAQWTAFARLLDAGARGAREGAAGGPALRVAVHVDRGGDPAGAAWFYDRLAREDVQFEVIGLSYYPLWHGPLQALSATVAGLAAGSGKEVMLFETSYPWTAQGATAAGNTVWSAAQLLPGLPATPAGQEAYLRTLIAEVAAAGGRGVFWWEPDWIAQPGMSQAPAGFETLALFDFSGRALPALGALRPP